MNRSASTARAAVVRCSSGTKRSSPRVRRASIPAAREKVEFAARFCEIGPSQPRWDSHRPVVELIFYLCKLDYDIKVLLLPS